MNLIELNHALRQLRLGGIADRWQPIHLGSFSETAVLTALGHLESNRSHRAQ